MDFYETIRAAVEAAGGGGALKTLPPNRWDRVSLNGKPVGPVLAHGVGLKGGSAWTYFTFKVDADGSVHTLWAQEDLKGELGLFLKDGSAGADPVGTALANPRVLMQPIVQGLALKVSLRFRFSAPHAQVMEYRFDGRSWP